MTPITRVVLYKHGIGHFEREGTVEGDADLSLTFRQAEVSDVLKSLTVLDLDGGHVASVSYDSTKPLEQLLADVALSIPDDGSLVGLLPQIKGARIAVEDAGQRVEGTLLGIDRTQRASGDAVVLVVLVSLLTDSGAVRQFDLHGLAGLEVLDPALRRDLDYYLRTQLSAKKKDARTFTFFAQGSGKRRIRLSYTLEAPVWKATYRILLADRADSSPHIQGWAVVDNTQDEDWNGVTLSLVAGLPVSFTHDLYTPRYIRRPVVEVKETTGVLPPVVEDGFEMLSMPLTAAVPMVAPAAAPAPAMRRATKGLLERTADFDISQTPQPQIRERKLGDLFEYQLERPVTIRRNQSALVPIVLKPFNGRMVLLHNRNTRPENPMRAVEFHNTTGLTLEGGPVTVLEGSSYVGEAMLETLKPDEKRLVPYAVELSVRVLDNVSSPVDEAHRVVIREGRMEIETRRIMTTTYQIDNRSGREYVCYLDHPRDSNAWKWIDTIEPIETTENYWRFQFALPPNMTGFTIKQQYTTRHTQILGGLPPESLQAIIDQKTLDEATRQAMRTALASLQRVTQIEQSLVRLDQERETIHREQGRIRQNLESLGDKSSEKSLRERLVKTLSDQEDRLEAIAAEHSRFTTAREQARAEFNERIGRLTFDGNRG